MNLQEQQGAFLSESEKQKPSIIGALFELDNTPYQVVGIDYDEDIGPLAVIQDTTSPADSPKKTVEPLDFVQMLVQKQQTAEQEAPAPARGPGAIYKEDLL